MGQFDPVSTWTAIAAVLSAIVLLGNAAEKIGKAVAAAKKPNDKQNERLGRLEERMNKVEDKLERDKTRLDNYGEGERVTQMALLALLDHNLDGNNVEQMKSAKDALQKHLLNK